MPAEPVPAPDLDEVVSPTDLVGACLGFVVASLGVGGVPEALGLSPSAVTMIVGLAGTLAATIRHFVRLRAAKKRAVG